MPHHRNQPAVVAIKCVWMLLLGFWLAAVYPPAGAAEPCESLSISRVNGNNVADTGGCPATQTLRWTGTAGQNTELGFFSRVQVDIDSVLSRAADFCFLFGAVSLTLQSSAQPEFLDECEEFRNTYTLFISGNGDVLFIRSADVIDGCENGDTLPQWRLNGPEVPARGESITLDESQMLNGDGSYLNRYDQSTLTISLSEDNLLTLCLSVNREEVSLEELSWGGIKAMYDGPIQDDSP